MVKAMTCSSPLRSLANLALCALIALYATGLPLSHDADHQSDAAHVEHDHGGHGSFLLEQEEQLLSKTVGFSAIIEMIQLPWAEATANAVRLPQERSFDNSGLDPPNDTRPRAPPITVS